jgi:hypothetical protein
VEHSPYDQYTNEEVEYDSPIKYWDNPSLGFVESLNWWGSSYELSYRQTKGTSRENR